MNHTTKIWVAFAAGALAGAAIGLLVAPGKGSETREKISREGKKMAEDLKKKFRREMEEFGELKEEFEQKLKERMEEFS
mgnify:CR=1 FL=1